MSKLNAELSLALALDGKLARLDDDTAALVAVVDALRALPEPEIDPVFARALEHRLLTEGLAEEAPVPMGRPQLRIVAFPTTPAEEAIRVAENVVTMPTRRVKVRKSFAAMAACFMLGAFPVMASSTALPGSPFYGMKQRLHAAQLALFGDAAQDATWRLGFATEHIHEAEALVGLGAEQQLVAEALNLAAYELAKATDTIGGVSDPAALAKFADEAAETQALLEKSAPSLTSAPAALGRVIDAANELAAVVNGSLGLGDVLSRVSGAALNETRGIMNGSSADAPSAIDAEASGSGDVTTNPGSGSGGSTQPGPKGGDKNDPDDGFGKGLGDATAKSCDLPGAVQVEQVAGAHAGAELCTSTVVQF